MPLVRKVEVACLSHSSGLIEFTRLAPAVAAFDAAFAAFTRAALVATDRGLVAISDLWPGDLVRTLDNGFQPLLWRGKTTLVARAEGQDPVMGRLTRIAADALGVARPMPDLVLAPHARLVRRDPAIMRLVGQETALVPARDLLDGEGVIEITPPAPVEAYHLGFAAHEIVIVNGVEIESFHPGPLHALGLRGEILDLYLSCFPHMRRPEDFGPQRLPRLRLADIEMAQDLRQA